MRLTDFWAEMTFRTRKFDLVGHPFFQSWIRGDLTHEEIGRFAREYYHHVAAFADYLRIFESRLAPGDLKELVSKVRRGIEGEDPKREACTSVWLSFAQAFSEGNVAFGLGRPGPEIVKLIDSCMETVLGRSPAEILAELWTHESTAATLSRETCFACAVTTHEGNLLVSFLRGDTLQRCKIARFGVRN